MLICLVLALATIMAYSPVRHAEFLTYDDEDHVTENLRIQGAMNWSALKWALTTTYIGGWHPVTWLVHMLNYDLFGLDPAGHHLANLFLHVANTLLLFGVLFQMTRARWRSALVAALFALHPLHVESVAWVSELKDVLSTFFFLLTLWAYTRYVKARPSTAVAGSSKGNWRWYSLALFFFALSLMSKTMAVTLPFLLLLLDFWPLQRFQLPGAGKRSDDASAFQYFSVSAFQLFPWRRLLLEKIPFLLLVLLPGVLQFRAIQETPSAESAFSPSFSIRLQNALVSYISYLQKTFWPDDLSAFYLNPGNWPLWQIAGAFALLLAVSLLVTLLVRHRPYLFVGWFWYFGTLVPVLGLIYQGPQAMADRYTYIPLMGLFVMLVWGLSDWIGIARLRIANWVVAISLLSICGWLTHQQVRVWRNSVSLFEHALAVQSPNAFTHSNLALALFARQRFDEAKLHFREALKLDPHYALAHSNLGVLLGREGKFDDAIYHFAQAIKYAPQNSNGQVNGHVNWGVALLQQGKIPEAESHFLAALKINPSASDANYHLGNVRMRQGRLTEAAKHLSAALQGKPRNADAHQSLGLVLLRERKGEAAQVHFQRAMALGADPAVSHYHLGNASQSQGKTPQAIGHYREALRLRTDFIEALNDLAWLLATHSDPNVRVGNEAVRLAERAAELTRHQNPATLDTLATAYASAGNFNKALETARQAESLARSFGQEELVAQINHRMQFYQAGKPYLE